MADRNMMMPADMFKEYLGLIWLMFSDNQFVKNLQAGKNSLIMLDKIV